METATLIPTIRERGYGANPYQWVNAYKVIAPNGQEIQPHMLTRSNQYEQSAQRYCKAQGWEYTIATSCTNA